MSKLIVLMIGVTFAAASCNLTEPLGITTGSRGIFKSEDGGESFRTANDIEKKGNINNVSVNALAFSPDNSEVIYLASNSGIYKTESAAAGWIYILSGIAVSDLAIDPRNPDVIYAAGVSGNNGKIIRSKDGGDNWSEIYTEPSKSNPVTSLAISQSTSVLIAGLASGEIIRSFDGGDSWQAGEDLQSRVIKIRFAGANSVYVLARTAGLFKSLDSGNAWTKITSVFTRDNVFSNPGVPAVSAFHDFAVDPRLSGVVYLAAEEGLFRTVSDGAVWNILNLPLKDTALKVSSLAVNPANSNNLFVSVGSTILKSSNGASTWETRELRTEQAVRVIAIDPQSPNVVYLGLGERK
ncbi:MAG: hypothetical protein HY395_02585 [Candidatus Doudnabacteria bacterium]|nr:hypothetical protein [Candidatus Doudnabacteria bacterium]